MKPRLILDLSYLNQFLTVPKFKFEDIRSVKDLFHKGDYFFKFDIHKGYYHINIFEPHVKYLAFSWIIDGQIRYFAYTVLVFGLSPAPFVFTKVVKVLIKHWRSSRIRLFGFIDDVFGGGRTLNEAQKISNLLRQYPDDSSFLGNTEKSIWVPCQRGQHLGYIVDLQKGIFLELKLELDERFALLEHIAKEKLVSAKFIAKLIGSIISMSLGVDPVCRLRTRMLYREVQKAISWDKKFFISVEAKKEVAFWYYYFHKYNGQPIWPSSPIISVLTYSDASSLAWGRYSINFCGLTAIGNFSESEMNSSSTWRELSATFDVLRSFTNLIERKVIKHRTDCQNVVRILHSGSKKFDLQILVCNIF